MVIGASAGGVTALQALVATLPAALPAPVVIAQHLDPTRPSHLSDILAARATLPVRVLTDHATLPLEPGVLYVVPSNRHIRLTDHMLAIEEGGAARPKPSIDRLLADAAAIYGEGLIAVILSGRGADGAVGARAVKAAGGTVVIQDPLTAGYPAMPLAVDPVVVDIVAEADQIGAALATLLSGEVLPTTPTSARALQDFLDEVRARSGIDFSLYKPPTIRRRLQRRLAAVGAESLTAYRGYLQGHPQEYARLVNSFLIKVTEFFRDPAFYAYLRDHIVPTLLTQARAHGHELRVWSAGCATGQEAYSLAILLAEALGDELEHVDIRLFATDLDAAAVAVARRGVYPSGDLATLPPALVARYFTRGAEGYTINKRIRALTVFGEHDLGQRAPFPRIDLCVCRNVLIYFTPALQAHALRLFAFALRDGGYLALGPSETARPFDDLFAPVSPALRIYRRQGERLTLAGTGVPVGRPPHPAPLGPLARRVPADTGAGEPSPHEGQARGLLALPVGVVVVDRRYDIRVVNNAARRLLGIHREAVGEDLIHLVRDLDAAALRAIIDAAFQPDAPRGADAALPGT
ncbi:MAG: PAS domain-containing protein, partial [Chloroflexi bacterium]|nr:PAS domain-containing protein [Chloroflexota bacterium]